MKSPRKRYWKTNESLTKIKRVLLEKKPFFNFGYSTMILKSSSFIFSFVFFFFNLVRKKDKLFSLEDFPCLENLTSVYWKRIVFKGEMSVCEKSNQQMIYSFFSLTPYTFLLFSVFKPLFFFFFPLSHQMSLL